MITLTSFVESFTSDPDLLRVAGRIPARVRGIRTDAQAGGLELDLDLDGAIPNGDKLIALESAIRSALSIRHVRLSLSGFPDRDGERANLIYPLLPWIGFALRRENPLFGTLLELTDFLCEGDALKGRLHMPIDESLEREFLDSAASFMDRYIEIQCPISIESPLDGHSVRGKNYISNFEDTLRKEAAEAAKRSEEFVRDNPDVSQKVPPVSDTRNQSKPRKKTDAPDTSGTGARAANSAGSSAAGSSDATLAPDSWAYKAKEATRDKNISYTRKPRQEGILWGKINPTLPVFRIHELNSDTGLALFDGYVEITELNLTKAGNKVRVNFYVTDATACVACVYFMNPADADAFEERFRKGGYARFQASVVFDARYTRDLQATVEGVMEADEPPKRVDTAPHPRVELHCHSKMSEKDAVIDVDRLFTEAARMGHNACAITDHGVVQGFPDAVEAYKKINKGRATPFKAILGMEGYLIDDGPVIAYHAPDYNEQLREDDKGSDNLSVNGFAALSVGTTGPDPERDTITAIGAIRYSPDGEGGYRETDSFYAEIRETDSDLTDKEASGTGMPAIDAVRSLSAFLGDLAVCGESVLTALSFLRSVGFSVDIEKHNGYRVKFNPIALDTSELLLFLHPQMAGVSLISAAESVSIPVRSGDTVLDNAGRSGDFLALSLRDRGVSRMSEWNELAGRLEKVTLVSRKQRVCHIIFLAKNALGLYHLYRMVSESHTEFYSHRPRIPKSEIRYYHAGLIIGSACERGEIFSRVLDDYRTAGCRLPDAKEAILRDDGLRHMTSLYDYLEIQPLSNNTFYLRNPESGLTETADLENLNRLIVDLGQMVNKPVCATTDAHFFEKSEGEYRKYILMDMDYKDAELQSDLYYRTTEEMLEEFSYLGDAKAYEVVVTNTNAVADRIQAGLKPFPDGTYPPIIDTAADDIRDLTWQAAAVLYEHNGEVHPLVKARVEKELASIIGNGFAIMYYIAYRLVKKSNEDGYIVGSRGSVGSSLVATFCGISEVNPLPPHYLCPACHYAIFDESGVYGSGYDLPPRDCPECGTRMRSDGQDIPFETFLGFFGDKQPDIDLNFSNEYQSKAHRYVAELFGESHTFRAGTISCFAEQNAIAVVQKIQEKTLESVSKAELRRRSLGLIGVKRTTGQHPGGIVVVPKEMDVYEFTPVQHPANKMNCGTTTTHFDFNAMHDTILKLDILGHYDPTMLRMLSDLTGVDVRTIPIPDEKVMSLFHTTDALGFPPTATDAKSGTLGLSEMGTFMARDMIAEAKPSSFYDLVQLMGLSHGTDVWKGNAQELIRNNTCTLKTVIGCRDGIMTQLIYWGLPNKSSFDIMEKVRKGKGLSAEHEALMREHNVPDWYIDSCKKIKYMFPKAHAAAYSISSLRIAWFKVYYPEEYYCAFFTIRAVDEFDGDYLCHGVERVIARRKELYDGFVTRKPNEKSEYYLCELVEEMYARGISFLPYDIDSSDATRFTKVAPGKILPPLCSIPTISAAIATSICEARAQHGIFKTREDLQRKSGIGPTALAKLISTGCLDHLPDSSQIDLFSFM